MELINNVPLIHFKPIVVSETKKKAIKNIYKCPCYYYPVRTGSRERPSFILTVELKSGDNKPDFWTKRGTALLMNE